MAYKIKELEQQAIKAIKSKKLKTFEDVIAFLPCSKTTFYDLKLNESDSIKKTIFDNRRKAYIAQLDRWLSVKNTNPATQIAAMKLLANEEEAHRLSGTRTEIKHKGGIESTLIEWKPAADLKK